MKIGRITEIRLRRFRCFRKKQTARMRPLTLLVGDNSTGKTSFLAAVRSSWDAICQQVEPDFRASPYDLGAFAEIVHHERGGQVLAESFEVGFRGRNFRDRSFDAEITFESRAAVPFPVRRTLKTRSVWVTFNLEGEEELIIDFGSKKGSWRSRLDLRYYSNSAPWHYLFFLASDTDRQDAFQVTMDRMTGAEKTPDSATIETISSMLQDLSLLEFRGKPFASAPIRSSPRRTYDPTKPTPDPEGAYIPTYFANVNFQGGTQWNDLKAGLERFGKMSGLFHEIGVKQLGEMEGGPFQLEIKVGGSGDARQRRNLIDVGYGVSQVLPVLTEVLRPDPPPMMLFQQPEVHLHPSAQAALGSLFCSVAAAGRQLVIETHSDYVIDRILLDIRDKRTKLKADDVSILYFERGDSDVSIHSIRIDAEGNLVNAPEGYRQFFKDELNRVIDY